MGNTKSRHLKHAPIYLQEHKIRVLFAVGIVEDKREF